MRVCVCVHGMLRGEDKLARINIEVPDASKNRFQRECSVIDSDMSTVLREFINQWLEEKKDLNASGKDFLVVALPDEQFRAVRDKAIQRKKDVGTFVRECLSSCIE